MEKAPRLRFVGRLALGMAVWFVAISLWFVCGHLWRVLTSVALMVFTTGAGTYVLGGGARLMIVSGLVVVVLALSPIEVSLRDRPGPMGVVPLVGGLLGPAGRERAARGEIASAGCIVTGFEPRWVVVW